MMQIYFVPDEQWSAAQVGRATLTFPEEYALIGRFELPDAPAAFRACQNPDWPEEGTPPSWPALLTPPLDTRVRSMSVGDLAVDERSGAVMQVQPIGWRTIGHVTLDEAGRVLTFTPAP